MKKRLPLLAALALLPAACSAPQGPGGTGRTLSPEARAALERIGSVAIEVGAEYARASLLRASHSGK